MAGAFRFVFQIRPKVSGRLDALNFQSKCFVNLMVVISDPFHCSGCHLEVEDTWCRAHGMSIALGGGGATDRSSVAVQPMGALGVEPRFP